MAWISGRVQSFLGPSRTARSASAAAADTDEKGAALTAEARGGRTRERRLRASSSIMAGSASKAGRNGGAATLGDTAEGVVLESESAILLL